MKVGFVSIINEPWGGSEELWAAAAHELLEKDHEVIISALSCLKFSSKIESLLKKKAKFISRRGFIQPGLPFKKRILKKGWLFFRNIFSNPYKTFFNQKPDIIVYTGACDSFKHDPHFLKMIDKTAIPFININQVYYEYQKTFNIHEAEIIKRGFNAARLNLFVSQRNKDVIERFLVHEIKNGKVVRNPINISLAEIIPFPPINQTVHFGMVANLLINHKGQDILFDILRGKKWQERNWHLNIFGAGIDEKYLIDLCAFYGLNNRVTFHGRTADIRKVWETNHIMLMPSRLEGAPLAVVEAMICGRPVVVTDVGGHMEWVSENEEGFIAEGANVISFDKAMERAWSKLNEWEAMGNKAHKKAIGLYDPHPGITLMEIILKTST